MLDVSAVVFAVPVLKLLNERIVILGKTGTLKNGSVLGLEILL